jgi:hypothetical protein
VSSENRSNGSSGLNGSAHLGVHEGSGDHWPLLPLGFLLALLVGRALAWSPLLKIYTGCNGASSENCSNGSAGLNGSAHLGVHELQEALSAAMIALDISSRKGRVAALQKRWDRLRARLDLILDQRGADMADLPGDASGLLVRDDRGKESDVLMTRRAPWCACPSIPRQCRGRRRATADGWA